MPKTVGLDEAVKLVKDGDVIMVGGFLGNGTPEPLIDALVESGRKDLTLVCNDTGFVDKGTGKMVVKKQFKKIIASHIGTNKETGRQMTEGETEVVLMPQGTLAEIVRAGAYGLGGCLTPTGIGTEAGKGREILEIKGKKFLLEPFIRGDVSLLYATKVDKAGNLYFKGSTKNFNVLMAGASTITMVLAEEIVEVGEIAPQDVHVSGVLIDYIVEGGQGWLN